MGHKPGKERLSGGFNQSTNPSGPVVNVALKAPDLLTIRKIPTTEDNQQYAEEKGNRAATLRTARHLNLITICGGIIALLSLVAVYASLWQSRQTFALGNRAWVTITDTPLSAGSIKDGVFNSVIVNYKNGGTSPAINFHTKMGPVEWTGAACQMKGGRTPYYSTMTLGPGATGHNLNEMFVVPQGCSEALNRGEAAFRYSGIMYYQDIFKESHSTWFCLQYEGKTTREMSYCPEGNGLD